MAKYISQKAAIAYIREQSEEWQKAFEELGGESGIYADAYNDLAEDFYSIPAADVAPVVHGRWKKDRDTIKCTVCGFGMFPNRYTFMHGVCVTDKKLPKYCENCGAKMGTTEEQSV